MTNTTSSKTGAELIAEERVRQLTDEGFSPEHDNIWERGELAKVAICYIQHAEFSIRGLRIGDEIRMLREWPSSWDETWWKPADEVRDLVKAGALIAAEIDRLLRAR
jgi:hypothetical protein